MIRFPFAKKMCRHYLYAGLIFSVLFVYYLARTGGGIETYACLTAGIASLASYLGFSLRQYIVIDGDRLIFRKTLLITKTISLEKSALKEVSNKLITIDSQGTKVIIRADLLDPEKFVSLTSLLQERLINKFSPVEPNNDKMT